MDDRSWTCHEKISTANVNCVEALEEEWDLFGSEKGNIAAPSVPAHVFKFTMRARRMVTPIESIGAGREFLAGNRIITGTISLVTANPDLVNNPFDMRIYDGQQHVATIYDLMFTRFQMEYSLVDRHIFEGDYQARSVELIHKDGKTNLLEAE